MVIIVGCIRSQPALRARLTAIRCFIESINPHCECLKQLFDNVAVGIVEVATEVRSGKCCEIPHAIDEKLRVGDAVFLFQFREKLFGWITASVLGDPDVKHSFCFNVYRSVQPRFLFILELYLFFIDRNAVWLSSESLLVVLRILLIPVVDRGSASFDAEPLTEVSAFCQGSSSGMCRARQPDRQAGVLVR